MTTYHARPAREAGQRTIQLAQALAWLAEEDTRRMIVVVDKERMRLRREHPEIAHQFVPMPRPQQRNSKFDANRIFIDSMEHAEIGEMGNDEIKAWLARPIIIEGNT